jgi:Flp pilus assembly CpaE family ATPase
VKAANEGRTAIDMFPREKVSEDFQNLAEQVVGAPAQTQPATPLVALASLFGRRRESARA